MSATESQIVVRKNLLLDRLDKLDRLEQAVAELEDSVDVELEGAEVDALNLEFALPPSRTEMMAEITLEMTEATTRIF